MTGAYDTLRSSDSTLWWPWLRPALQKENFWPVDHVWLYLCNVHHFDDICYFDNVMIWRSSDLQRQRQPCQNDIQRQMAETIDKIVWDNILWQYLPACMLHNTYLQDMFSWLILQTNAAQLFFIINIPEVQGRFSRGMVARATGTRCEEILRIHQGG